MPYQSTKTYGHDQGLSACFRQWRATHSHCSKLHGYALAFTIVFEADELDERNWVMDFGGLKELKSFLVNTFDHKLVVAEDDPYLDEITALGGIACADVLVLPAVGCEAFAKLVYDWASQHYGGVWRTDNGHERVMRVVSVECREHGANSALYIGGK